MVTNQQILGISGEILVYNSLNLHGISAELVPNAYDSRGDLYVYIEGIRMLCEVKSQTPYIKEECFTFNIDQLQKCLNAYILFFVFIPHLHQKYYHKLQGHIFACDYPKNLEYKVKKIKDDDGVIRDRVLVPFNQKGIRILEKISDDDIKALQIYSTSKYNR